VTERTDDIVSHDDDGGRPRRIARRRATGGRRRWLPAPALVTVMSTALAMVFAGDVTTAALRFASGDSGAGPESLIPASAFGVAIADLRVSRDEIGAFASHFPGSPTIGSSSPVDALLKAALESGTPKLDYDHDLAPWLGDRIGFAGWVDNGKPQTELLLQCTDADAARAAIPRLDAASGGGPTHYVIKDGYVVIGDTDAAVHDALAAAAERSLADNGTWAADVAGLRDGAVVTGWLNGPGAADLLSRAFSDVPPAIPGFGDALTQLEKARAAVGLYVGDNTVELDERAVDAPTQPAASSALMTDLPDHTIGAAEIGGTDLLVNGFMAGVRAAMTATATSESGCGFAAPPPVMLGPGQQPGPKMRRVMRREHLLIRHERQKLRTECRPQPVEPPRPPDPLQAITKATGLQVPADLRTLIGNGIVVAYGGLELGALPDAAVRTEPDDLAAAHAVADRLGQHLAAHGINLGVVDAGKDLVVATSDGYASQVATGGHLGDQDSFRAAMGDLPAQVTTAFYLDLSGIWPMAGLAGSDVSRLQSVGVWSSAPTDGVTLTQMRVVVAGSGQR
jgi:hypothetical protein